MIRRRKKERFVEKQQLRFGVANVIMQTCLTYGCTEGQLLLLDKRFFFSAVLSLDTNDGERERERDRARTEAWRIMGPRFGLLLFLGATAGRIRGKAQEMDQARAISK